MAIPNELDQILGDLLPNLRVNLGRIEEIGRTQGREFTDKEYSKFLFFRNALRGFTETAGQYQDSLGIDESQPTATPPKMNPDFPKQGTPEYLATLEEH